MSLPVIELYYMYLCFPLFKETIGYGTYLSGSLFRGAELVSYEPALWFWFYLWLGFQVCLWEILQLLASHCWINSFVKVHSGCYSLISSFKTFIGVWIKRFRTKIIFARHEKDLCYGVYRFLTAELTKSGASFYCYKQHSMRIEDQIHWPPICTCPSCQNLGFRTSTLILYITLQAIVRLTN